METTTKTPYQTALYYGAILGILTAIVTSFDSFLSTEFKVKNSGLFGLIIIIFYIVSTSYLLLLGLKAQKEQQDGFLTFGTGMNMSLWIGIVSSLVAQVWNIFRMYVLFPNSLEEVKNMQRMMYEEMGFNDAVIEQQIKMTETMMQPYIILPMNVILGTIFVIIIGLIVAAIVKKEKEHPF